MKDRFYGISPPLTKRPRKNKYWTSPKWQQATTEVVAPTEEEAKAEETEAKEEEEEQVGDPNPEEAVRAPEVGDPKVEAKERVEITDEKNERIRVNFWYVSIFGAFIISTF